MPYSRLTLHPALGTEVLHRLREFAALPKKGVIAGQAVASVLDHMQGLKLSPVNDIDVFRLAARTRLTRKGQMGCELAFQTGPGLGLTRDYNALKEFLRLMRSYKVSTVSTEGLLNYVNCELPNTSFVGGLTAPRVLQSFDLNCVRVAVDIADGRLYWDRHYAEFLKHRQIRICAVHTPWHTFLRALKKAHELPDVSLDLPTAALITSAIEQSALFENFLNAGSISRFFGQKCKSIADRHSSYVHRYFDLDAAGHTGMTADGQEYKVYSMKARGQVDAALMRRVNQLYGAQLHFCGPLLHDLMSRSSGRIADRVQEMDALLGKRPCALARQFEQNPVGFVSGHYSVKHLDVVSEALDRLPQLKDAFCGLTLDEQFEAAKRLLKLMPQYDHDTGRELLTRLRPAHLRDVQGLEEVLAAWMNRELAPLHRPRKIRDLDAVKAVVPYPCQVRELLSPHDLRSAGEYTARWDAKAKKALYFEFWTVEEGQEHYSVAKLSTKNGKPSEVQWHRHRELGKCVTQAHQDLRRALMQDLVPGYVETFDPANAAFVDLDQDIPF